MSSKTAVVIRNEFKATIGRRAFIVTSLVVPALAAVVLLIFVVVQSARTDPEDAPGVGYIDESGLLAGEHRVGETTFQPFDDRESGIGALLEERIEHLIEIPQDYLQTGLILQIRLREEGIAGFDAAEPPVGPLLVESLLADRVPPDVTERVRAPARFVVLEIDDDGRPVDEPFDGGRLLFFMVAAGLALFSTVMTSGFFQEGLSEEKENRIMEVLLSSARPRDLMAGKLIALGGVGLAQFLFWGSCVAIVVGALRLGDFAGVPAVLAELTFPPAGYVVAALALFFLGYAFGGTLLGLIGAITTSHREAQQVAFLVIIPYFVPLWFIAPILADPTGVTSRVLTFIPFTAPVTNMVRMGMDATSAGEILLAMGVLAVAVVAAVFVTLRVFELSLLMYGKRPGAGQVARAVLGRAA